MRKRTLVFAAAGALLATAIVGGLALAAIPGAGGVINGCYQKNEGQLRVIDAATDSCRPSEVPLSWNQTGAAGLQGEQGEQGVPGAAGRNGADGHDGQGVTVTPEPAGPNCATGGIKLTASNGVAYVCNAPPPDPGEDQ